MDGTHETDAGSESFDEGPITPTRIGLAAGLMDVVVFSAVGYLALEDVAVGGVAGLAVGAGVALFLPVFLMVGEDGSLGDLEPADHDAPLREFHRVAAGFALGVGGLTFLAAGFAETDLVVGLLGGLVAASVVYLAAGFVMPNARPNAR